MRRSREDIGFSRNGCRNLRRHAQLFKTQSAIPAAIQMNFFVKRRLQPQSAKRQMLKRFQQLSTVLQQQLLVASIQIGDHFGIASGVSGHRVYRCFQLKSSGAHRLIEEFLQRVNRRVAVQMSVLDKFLRHRLS